jgi:hypothetical protein
VQVAGEARPVNISASPLSNHRQASRPGIRPELVRTLPHCCIPSQARDRCMLMCTLFQLHLCGSVSGQPSRRLTGLQWRTVQHANHGSSNNLSCTKNMAITLVVVGKAKRKNREISLIRSLSRPRPIPEPSERPALESQDCLERPAFPLLHPAALWSTGLSAYLCADQTAGRPPRTTS